jgi:hypothetical protein
MITNGTTFGTKSMKLALIVGVLAYGVSAQEFTLATPKGDVVVKVTQNNFTLGQSFHMIGAITNVRLPENASRILRYIGQGDGRTLPSG